MSEVDTFYKEAKLRIADEIESVEKTYKITLEDIGKIVVNKSPSEGDEADRVLQEKRELAITLESMAKGLKKATHILKQVRAFG